MIRLKTLSDTCFVFNVFCRVYFGKIPLNIYERELRAGNADLVVNDRLFMYRSKSKSEFQLSNIIFVDPFCPVAPIITQTNFKNEIIFCTIYIVMLIGLKILSYFLNFESTFWSISNLFRIAFGISVAKSPRRAVERMIFMCTIVLSFVCSSIIFNAIFRIQLNQEKELEFKEIKDLYDQNFTFQVAKSVFFYFNIYEYHKLVISCHFFTFSILGHLFCLKLISPLLTTNNLTSQSIWRWELFCDIFCDGISFLAF